MQTLVCNLSKRIERLDSTNDDGNDSNHCNLHSIPCLIIRSIAYPILLLLSTDINEEES